MSTSDKRKYLTEEELKRFFGVVKNPRDRAIFTIAYWRGLRASEIGNIPWSDWNQKKRNLDNPPEGFGLWAWPDVSLEERYRGMPD